MRTLVLAAIIVGSSLYPALAQEAANPPAPAQNGEKAGASAPSDQNAPHARNPATGRDDQASADDRKMGRDWRMHQNGDRSSDEREPGRDWRMREPGRDRDFDGGGYRDRGDRYHEHGERYGRSRDYGPDEDRPWRRVKICVEYPNGDEYCHYRR